MMSYSAIDNEVAVEATAMVPKMSDPRSTGFKDLFVGKSKDKLTIGGLLGLFVVASVLFVNGFSSGNSTPELYQRSSSHSFEELNTPKKCTFEECNAASCDHDKAPFTCVKHNGGPHGGCSPSPWTHDTCDYQCDLSDCENVDIPSSAKSCKHVKCDKAWCSSDNALRCPDDVPYQCLEGSARFGCSADLNMWAFKTPSTTCSKCCDTVTCEDHND